MNFIRLYQSFFSMGLFLAAAHVCAMNVTKNYEFRLKDSDARYCIPQEDCDRALPYLLPDKKHTSCLQQTLYDGFMNECLFVAAMTNSNELPAEIINLIVAQSRIIADQHRNLWAEEVLQERHGITYTDLCSLTKAHKQFLLYCITDAPYNNGILTIEGGDAAFSGEMRERFYSLPNTIQAKLARHANGTSIYVKKEQSLFNRLLGEDVVARDRNTKRLATMIEITVPVALVVIATAIAIKYKISHQALWILGDRLVVSFNMASDILTKGIALGTTELMMFPAVVAGCIAMVPLVLAEYAVVFGIPISFIVLGFYVYDKVMNVLNEKLPQAIQRRFEEIFVATKRNA